MKILITGVPGTGKTTLSQYLSQKLGYHLININDIAKKFKTGTGRWGESIINIKKSEKEINKILKDNDNVIIEGHLGCDMKLNVDIVIVLRCNPKTLKKRLKKRGYPQDKITENIEAEMIDYCIINSEENYELHRKIPIIEVLSQKGMKKDVLTMITRIIKTKQKIKSRKINVDWLSI
ncbi:AAA family ATPase [Candidatus Micrarchaeota archaeon]|nr:AAA family ATPase [Candidatus Micrarchaeota archaeon]